MIELEKKDIEKIYELADKWELATDDYVDEKFDYEAFKLMAKESYSYLERYYLLGEMHLEIVLLLLKIKEFACYPLYFSVESAAAQAVASTLCDLLNNFGIMEFYPSGKREFVVEYGDGYCPIDTSTFDLTELINALGQK